MAENRRKPGWKLFPAELAILILGGAGMWFLGGIRQMAADKLLGGCVMTVLGLAVTGYHFRRAYLWGELDYNNGEHVFRFWLCMGIGLAIAFACGFLPVAGWPYLLVYVMLALFSNMSTGMLAATMLLAVSATLSGSAEGLVLYLVCGAFSVTLFRRLERDFKFGIPFFLSILCLLVCETANVVLTANARLDPELFVIPAANMIISGILLVGCLKLFSSMVVYQHREDYLDINDTENPVLARFREENRKEYMYAVHTTYFCERIAARLTLDADALKCAGYYYRLGGRLEEMAAENGFPLEKKFPPAAREILEEYRERDRKPVVRKETAVLICAEAVVTAVSGKFEKDPGEEVDYDLLVDGIFEGLLSGGGLDQCGITIGEFRRMQRLFKEEKLYYDFLR